MGINSTRAEKERLITLSPRLPNVKRCYEARPTPYTAYGRMYRFGGVSRGILYAGCEELAPASRHENENRNKTAFTSHYGLIALCASPLNSECFEHVPMNNGC